MLPNFIQEIALTCFILVYVIQYVEQIHSVIFLTSKRSRMVMNQVAIFSSFTYGNNPCSSTLLVELLHIGVNRTKWHIFIKRHDLHLIPLQSLP